MWLITLFAVKSVTNTFISLGEKTKQAKKWQPVGSLFLLSSCCKQATAGMQRGFSVYFVPLQSNSTQCNMHSSHVATENCMKCGFSYETDCWRNYCEERFWMKLDILCRCRSLTMVDLTECCTLTMHRNYMLIKIPTLNVTHLPCMGATC